VIVEFGFAASMRDFKYKGRRLDFRGSTLDASENMRRQDSPFPIHLLFEGLPENNDGLILKSMQDYIQ
jgi:hypothetical protein